VVLPPNRCSGTSRTREHGRAGGHYDPVRALAGGQKDRAYTTDREDQPILRALVADVRAQPRDDPKIEAERVSTLPELMRRMASIDVGFRYHNVLCALKLSKPPSATRPTMMC
jgi:hypothetical protein